MNIKTIQPAMENIFIRWLKRIPFVSSYSRTRGWSFLISWFHRFSGILLVMSLWIYFACFQAFKASHPFSLLFLLLWTLSIPMAFHGANGARLILYEFFGKRNDEAMIRAVLAISMIYVAGLGMLMLMGNQVASPFLFWLIMVVQGLIMAYSVAERMQKSEHSTLWKLQRISGSFLLVMVPAYFLFISLDPLPKVDQGLLITVFQRLFLMAVYTLLLLSALFHGGYGVWSVISDYLAPGKLRKGSAMLITAIMLVFAWIGLRFALNI